MLDRPIRQFSSSFVIFSFVVFFSTYGLCNEIATQWPLSRNHRFPDFSKYQSLRILSPQEFPLDDPERRVLLVGDIHGMYNDFTNLLEKASYDHKSDVLIHVGDVVTKAPNKHSLKILEYLASNNITGVRGNNDQTVVEWRGWIRWIRSLPGGTRWLNRIYLKWREEKRRGARLKVWLDQEMKRDSSPWWKKIPKGWKLFSEHFDIAHDMTDEQYDYLRSLPLVLYVPSAHAFIAHAGLLSSNPKYPFDHPNQPLASIPSLPLRNSTLSHNDTYPLLRRLQELSILNDVPQNTVPWNVLNMRTVHNGKISRKTHGQRWTSVWNHDMSRCHGFDIHAEGVAKDSLPCYPSTVIYGHYAKRGLDIKQWSIGLDSGCARGRRLAALILGSGTSMHIDVRKDDTIPFGESGYGKIVSISCS